MYATWVTYVKATENGVEPIVYAVPSWATEEGKVVWTASPNVVFKGQANCYYPEGNRKPTQGYRSLGACPAL